MLLQFNPINGAHMKVVPLIPVTDDQKKIHLNKSQVKFLPGTNEVTDAEWSILQTHLAQEIADGVIVLLDKKVAVAPGRPGGMKSLQNLAELPTRLAIEYVEQCINPDTLLKWYGEEFRDEVRTRISRKMEILKVDFPSELPPYIEPPDLEADLSLKTNKELNDIAVALGINTKSFGKKSQWIEAIEAARGIAKEDSESEPGQIDDFPV
ncbi:hypothetical protein FACS1894172_14910 [Spirochaetia bacterium]|nr:hypothetical protein FACS1894172_14910 [Spirochaetia bacterium]